MLKILYIMLKIYVNTLSKIHLIPETMNARNNCRVRCSSMIQTIVFDADGVLVKPPSWFVTRAHELYGVPKSEFMAFIHGEFKRCTIGALDLEVALVPLLERWQVPVSIPEFIRTWLEYENVIDPVMLEEVRALRASGMPCFVGTNQERNRANFMRLEMGLQADTDGVFASCDLGARKPDRAFFDRLAERLKLEPALEPLDGAPNILRPGKHSENTCCHTRNESSSLTVRSRGPA
jgi:putative hydrolase of the HAD superfamily